MNANDVIESYVADVAAQLPARLRYDVAAELRALLGEELHAKSPRGAESGKALALVRAFGKPSDVAARYRTPYVLIEPSDTRAFILAALVGGALIPGSNRHLPVSLDAQTALLLQLAWLGMLVVFFAVLNWARRRWPDSFQWQPSLMRDPEAAPAATQIGLVLVYALAIVFYLVPGAVLGSLSGGQIDATYTDDFRQPLRFVWFPLLLGILAVTRLIAAVQRRRTRTLRIVDICFLICAGTQLGWHASYGNLFRVAAIDHNARLIFQLVGGLMVIVGAVRIYREWIRVPPVPARQKVDEGMRAPG